MNKPPNQRRELWLWLRSVLTHITYKNDCQNVHQWRIIKLGIMYPLGGGIKEDLQKNIRVHLNFSSDISWPVWD